MHSLVNYSQGSKEIFENFTKMLRANESFVNFIIEVMSLKQKRDLIKELSLKKSFENFVKELRSKTGEWYPRAIKEPDQQEGVINQLDFEAEYVMGN